MSTQVIETALKTLRAKNELKSKIATTIAEIPDAGYLGSLGMKVGDSRVRLASFINNNGGSEGAINPSRIADLAALKADFEQKFGEYNAVKEIDTRLRGELVALQQELAATPFFAGIEELLVINGELSTVKDGITALNAALNKQETVANDIFGADDLVAKRDELLADAALGLDVKEQLDSVQKKLAAAEKQAEKGADAEQAAIVLKRRLLVSIEKYTELMEARKLAMAGLLREQGSIFLAEYQDIVASLATCVTRLFVVDALLNRHAPSDDTARFVSADMGRFKLPSLSSPGAEAVSIFPSQDIDIETAVEHEITRLNELTGGALFPPLGL